MVSNSHYFLEFQRHPEFPEFPEFPEAQQNPEAQQVRVHQVHQCPQQALGIPVALRNFPELVLVLANTDRRALVRQLPPELPEVPVVHVVHQCQYFPALPVALETLSLPVALIPRPQLQLDLVGQRC